MSIIIGIDHGYYAIKTAHCAFPAGLTSYGEHEPYQSQDKQLAIAEYNDEERTACRAWGVDLLCDIFPQADELPAATHSAGWAVPIPTTLSTEKDALDAIAWPGLVDCIICGENDFDAHWQKLQDDLDAAGRADAEAAMTQAVQGQMAFWKSLE